MDELDLENNAVETAPASNKMALVGMVMGLIGIIMGITGIVLANGSMREVKAIKAEMANSPDNTPQLEKAIADLDDRLVKLGGELLKLNKQDQQIRNDTQKAFDSVSKEIRDNRTEINELVGSLKEIADKMANWQPGREKARPATSTEAVSGGGSGGPTETLVATESTDEDGTYSIQSGDTLSAVAKKFGITLSELLNANPGINPRALQIGQKVLIPKR